MACKKCGSDWVTAKGKDCKSCPHCCKVQRCVARKAGRWIEFTEHADCKVCGTQFVNTGADVGKNKCCSVECRDASRKAWRTEYAASYNKGKRRGTQQKKRPKPICRRCGCSFSRRHSRNDSNIYCSKVCFFAAVNAGEQQFVGRVRDAWAGFVDWAYEWEPQRPRKRKDYKPRPACEVCGVEVNNRRSKCCSYECKKAWRGPRQCKCGSIVQNATLFGRPHCVVCRRRSKALQRRMFGCYRRRCRTYGGLFNPTVRPKDVFERARWRCHVCGRKTSKVFSYKDPRSATVDHHPIPLSKGGDHDWHNVRCACKQCNETKSNKWDRQPLLKMRME